MIANKETVENAQIIDTKYDLAEKAIKTGEKTELIMEMLVEQLGLSLESTFNQIWTRLMEVHKEHNEAMKLMSELIHINAKNKQTKTPIKTRGVSVSN